jgi:hypothetical protein
MEEWGSRALHAEVFADLNLRRTGLLRATTGLHFAKLGSCSSLRPAHSRKCRKAAKPASPSARPRKARGVHRNVLSGSVVAAHRGYAERERCLAATRGVEHEPLKSHFPP